MAIQITLRISNDRNVLTIEKMIKLIRSKGLVCSKVSENSIVFEKDGVTYRIIFDGKRFQLGLVYSLDDGAPAQMLLMASNQLNLEGCGVKASLNIDTNNPGNNKLVFSVDGFCHRPKDFATDFDFSMEALKGGVERHRSICQKISSDESRKTSQRKIGFVQNYK